MASTLEFVLQFVKCDKVTVSPNQIITTIIIIIISYGIEVEIQLPLKRFPDSRVSSLIRTGWCKEGIPPPKARSNAHGWITC